MKKHFLTIWISLLAACALYMAASAVIGRAQDGATGDTAERPDYCAPGASDYNDENKGLEDVMAEYHGWVNETFNKNIRAMIAAEAAAAKATQVDPRGVPPADGNGNYQQCPEDNYSTYCVGMKILNDEKKGYKAYIRALDCRRSDIFDTKEEYYSFLSGMEAGLETAMSGGLSNPAITGAVASQPLQTQKAMEVSTRLEAIDREKAAAKRALDQTLSAYDQLRTAWPMHKQYMKIYDDLIKYRDKMVEIRKQVEEFPSKFIDASTTKCT